MRVLASAPAVHVAGVVVHVEFDGLDQLVATFLGLARYVPEAERFDGLVGHDDSASLFQQADRPSKEVFYQVFSWNKRFNCIEN